jgi:8-oxo-dGTP diphosphatase
MPKSDQGIRLDRFLIIPRTLIFVRKGHEVLLLKGAPTKRLWANRYNGIGGHVEKGEDPLSAARRELLEESNLECPDLWLCGTIIVDAGEQVGVGIYVFSGTQTQGQIRNSEEGSLEWIALDRIDHLPLVEDLKIILPRIFNSKRGEPPFSARSYYDARNQLVVEFS